MELYAAAAKDCVKHGAALVFAMAFPVLRHVHASITALIVLVRKIVKMMMIVMTILMMMDRLHLAMGSTACRL